MSIYSKSLLRASILSTVIFSLGIHAASLAKTQSDTFSKSTDTSISTFTIDDGVLGYTPEHLAGNTFYYVLQDEICPTTEFYIEKMDFAVDTYSFAMGRLSWVITQCFQMV
jgi:hypothetical protein